jgi:predicted nucleic acid-binding protein
VASFVDTNVLVYAFDRGDERKRRVALDLLDEASMPVVVSTQVLLEFYWTVTRKLEPPLAGEEAHDVVRHLSEGAVVPTDASLVDAAIALARRHRLALWDATIVVAAQRACCDELLTEDMSDGAAIEGVTIRDPFRTRTA